MKQRRSSGLEVVQWKPPRAGFSKINIDAAVLGPMGCGLGMIIRDHNGTVEWAGVQQTRERWDAGIAEAKAMEFGLRTAVQMGLANIIVESDCMVLVSMLKSKSLPLNYLGNVGRSVLSLASCFNVVEFSFVKRDGNRAAQCLAHLLPLTYSTRMWVGMVPDIVSDVVLTDCYLVTNNE
ncbi:uncharacterized protein LOC141641741 [Silene latifolia]|uniref:uncharacterized protein LOC141641741 n=1 Tax=Silene latifolia TaxID=37657 RepID=UPI003D789473